MALLNAKTLKSITIPKNIKTIGKYAFDGCTGLINATIPTTVSSVGDYAFNNCTGLKKCNHIRRRRIYR